MKQLTFLLLLAQVWFVQASEQKFDILGLYAGMPSGVIASLLRTKGWRCQNRNDPVIGKAPDPITGDFAFNCDTSVGQLDFTLAGSLNDTPLYRARLLFTSAEKLDNVVRSVSEQYRKEATITSNVDYRWQLDNGSMLKLSGGAGGYMLELTSTTIQEANATAKAAKDIARNPTPKF